MEAVSACLGLLPAATGWSSGLTQAVGWVAVETIASAGVESRLVDLVIKMGR